MNRPAAPPVSLCHVGPCFSDRPQISVIFDEALSAAVHYSSRVTGRNVYRPGRGLFGNNALRPKALNRAGRHFYY